MLDVILNDYHRLAQSINEMHDVITGELNKTKKLIQDNEHFLDDYHDETTRQIRTFEITKNTRETTFYERLLALLERESELTQNEFKTFFSFYQKNFDKNTADMVKKINDKLP